MNIQQIQEIQTNLIDTPEFYFKLEDPILLLKLENSIRTFGLMRPIVVKQVGSRYELVEGRQILKVIHKLLQKAIYCVILQPEIDSPATNLMLNITAPQESLARIAHFMKERTGLVGEAMVSSMYPYSIDEIKRFVEICTFDWAQFEKKQNAGNLGMFDAAPEEIQLVENQTVTNEQESPKEELSVPIASSKITYVQLSPQEIEREETNTHESEDKNLIKQEGFIDSLRKELLAEKAAEKRAEENAALRKKAKSDPQKSNNLFE